MSPRPVRTSVALFVVASSFLTLLLAGCGGGNKGPDPTLHTVTITWTANREVAVNRAGGGYIVNISGQAPINVPYVSGPLAPTSTTLSLWSGTYTVTVSGYSALNPSGAPATMTLNVPF